MKNDIAEKPKVTTAQQQLLTQRYELTPRLDSAVKMSRGKPLAVGPTARLSSGASWQSLAQMPADEIRKRNVFPYPSLPHPKHAAGGMVFPQAQIEMFPRLERFDVDFDIPEAFLPEFLHDGRLLTLEDTVEFFNLVLGLKLSDQEKSDLVAFMRVL